jgi:hypothetical protein
MIVTVKNMHQENYEFDVDISIQLKDLHDMICVKFNYENARLIYSGRIMDLTESLSKYMKETDRGFIVVMKVNSGTNQVNWNTNTSTSSTQAQINTTNNQVNTTNQNLNQYNFRQVRAAIIGMLRFISTNPLLNYTYFTSPTEFYETMRGDTFTDVIQQILNTSDEIAETLEDNSTMDIHIRIPQQTPTTQTPTTQTPTTQTPTTQTPTTQTPTTQTPTRTTQTLTEEDRNNIQTLINLGYNEQHSIIAYLMANKNINLAASILLDE